MNAESTGKAGHAADGPHRLFSSPHRRFNPLLSEWVLVSPHRTDRPWLGHEELPGGSRTEYDPQCYLCPGNSRAGGRRNPDYRSIFVFENDFAALLSTAPENAAHREGSMFTAEPVTGTCRVICYSPRHDLTMAEMPVADIAQVVDEWARQFEELGRRYRWVQVFENKGTAMGCSNLHPHGQIWATSVVPNVPAREDHHQREIFRQTGKPLLVAYAEQELEKGERIVTATRHWVALVPFWAVWPFEVLVLPQRHVARFEELSGAERTDLAALLKSVLVRYDNLFRTSFPYSMGWHSAPPQEKDVRHWQVHAHLLPPLLRSASVRKFMVGYELLGEPQRDLTPERAAERLRQLSDQHYRAPS